MTAYIYNKLYNLQVLEAKIIAEQLFFVFIAVASLAAVAFAILSIYLFVVSIRGKFNNKKLLSIFNPLLIMLVLIGLSKILPSNKVVNGIFAWGQQSIALFITFSTSSGSGINNFPFSLHLFLILLDDIISILSILAMEFVEIDLQHIYCFNFCHLSFL